MNDFKKSPIERNEQKGWIGTHELESDKRESDHGHPPSSQTGMVLAGFAYFFKKILYLIIPAAATTKTEIASLDKQYVADQLRIFKTMLMIMAREDQSQNAEFVQELSEVWQKLTEICNNEFVTKKFPTEALKLKLLIKQILLYPPSEDHSLGSYLFKQVGTRWLPFPFITILQNLHANYRRDPRLSELSVWLAFLTEIITTIESK